MLCSKYKSQVINDPHTYSGGREQGNSDEHEMAHISCTALFFFPNKIHRGSNTHEEKIIKEKK